eukprot:TRINITY_DN39013_c0_g1_i2.p1 TRINITY_DN39013_c0_g1~~TRINITY_DN39013_c0_g1_i2.p1  ORF type:complete len:125 (-),score=19.47 TRINITY_DN39013_c0_g1_i2:176-550(-)
MMNLLHMTDTQQILQKLEDQAETVAKELTELFQSLADSNKSAVTSTSQHVEIHEQVIQQLKRDSEDAINAGDELLQKSQQVFQRLQGVDDLHLQVQDLKKQVDALLKALVSYGVVILKEDTQKI